MTSSPSPSNADADADASAPWQLVTTRISVNAPSAYMAATISMDNYYINLANAAGFKTESLIDEAEALLDRPPSTTSLLSQLPRDEDDEQGLLSGYWVVVVLAKELRPKGLFWTDSFVKTLHVERLSEPHRDPLAYGGFENDPRNPKFLRQETQAYWEAMDLRASISREPAERTAGPRL